MAAILGAEALDQLHEVELLPLRAHRASTMGRPRKPPAELTTEEAVKKLFPRKVITRAKQEAKKADEKATKREPKP